MAGQELGFEDRGFRIPHLGGLWRGQEMRRLLRGGVRLLGMQFGVSC